MSKLEFCLFAIGNLIEEKEKDLSKKLINLAGEAHYYYSKDQLETWGNLNDIYDELFIEFNNFQKEKLNKGEYEKR